MKKNIIIKKFNFKFYTSQYVTKTGSTYNYVYDQGYLPLDNDWFLLVKTDMVL